MLFRKEKRISTQKMVGSMRITIDFRKWNANKETKLRKLLHTFLGGL